MEKRALHLALAFLLFPLPILVIVPGILIWQFGFEVPAGGYWGYWVAKIFIPVGLATAGYCVVLFFIEGKGSPAPWCPPTKLMVTGPYRYVRNPMNLGVVLALCGLSLVVTNPSIAIWAGVVFVIYLALFIFIEEPALEKRFGDDYVLYKANVGRIIPRLSGWDAPWVAKDDEEKAKDTKDEDQE